VKKRQEKKRRPSRRRCSVKELLALGRDGVGDDLSLADVLLRNVVGSAREGVAGLIIGLVSPGFHTDSVTRILSLSISTFCARSGGFFSAFLS
jgi:hypothetical protein